MTRRRGLAAAGNCVNRLTSKNARGLDSNETGPHYEADQSSEVRDVEAFHELVAMGLDCSIAQWSSASNTRIGFTSPLRSGNARESRFPHPPCCGSRSFLLPAMRAPACRGFPRSRHACMRTRWGAFYGSRSRSDASSVFLLNASTAPRCGSNRAAKCRPRDVCLSHQARLSPEQLLKHRGRSPIRGALFEMVNV